MHSSLVHVERQAWPLWHRAFTATNASAEAMVEPECGEHMRVVTSRHRLFASSHGFDALIRFIQPIDIRLPLLPLREGGFAKAVEELNALADAQSVRFVAVQAIRRHGQHVAARLRAQFGSRFESFEQAGPDDQVLMISVSDVELFAGTTTRRKSRSPYAAGIPPGRPHDPMSRARWKLREAFDWLSLCEPGWTVPKRWIDLGAFPGGMSRELVDRGATVSAVDLATPQGVIIEGVTWHQMDAMIFTPSTQHDAVVCDINGTPSSAAKAASRLTRWLSPGALVIHTMKLPHWEDFRTVRQRVESIFDDAGLATQDARHLVQNRQEITLIARLKGERA